MQSSPLPVRTWLYAMYQASKSGEGIGVSELSEELGVTKKTALHIIYRIHEACANYNITVGGIADVYDTCDGTERRVYS